MLPTESNVFHSPRVTSGYRFEAIRGWIDLSNCLFDETVKCSAAKREATGNVRGSSAFGLANRASVLARAYLNIMVLLRDRRRGFIEPCLPSPAKAPPTVSPLPPVARPINRKALIMFQA
jgi:hypothetical protein